jgi:hypothetical protein
MKNVNINHNFRQIALAQMKNVALSAAAQTFKAAVLEWIE